MGHNMASWKLLEDMMIELKKKGVTIPSNVLEDLRAAKSMIKLSCMEGSQGRGRYSESRRITRQTLRLTL